jgi:hypothetical protein
MNSIIVDFLTNLAWFVFFWSMFVLCNRSYKRHTGKEIVTDLITTIRLALILICVSWLMAVP